MTRRKTRMTLIIGTVAVLALALVSWFVILSPRLSTAAEVQSEAKQLDSANLALHNQYNRELTLAKDAPAAAKDAQALFATMPEQADLPAVIEQITAAAEAAGIPAKQVELISTSVPQPIGPREAAAAAGAAAAVKAGVNIATMKIDISAGGTQAQVMAFIDNLQALDRALLITSTQVVNNGAAKAKDNTLPEQSVQIGGTMFVLESKLPDLVASIDNVLPADLQASAAPVPEASASASPTASPDASSTPLPLQP